MPLKRGAWGGRGVLGADGLATMDPTMSVPASGGFDDLDLDLSRMSSEELRDTLMVVAGDLDDLHQLVTPLKVENARLAQSGKHLSGLVQEVVKELREFFSEKAQRDWYKSQDEDEPVHEFFRSLIRWYQRICDDDNPTLAFYKRVWEYERGDDDDPVGRLGDAALPQAPRAKPSASTKEASDSKKADRRPGPTSANLYDACLARSETTLFRESVDKLQRENASLRQKVSALEAEVKGLQGADAPSARGRSGHARSTEMPKATSSQPPTGFADGSPGGNVTPRKPRSGTQASPPAGRTLGQMAAGDPRWKRLLEDSDQLFSEQDIINETYEEYLGDILALMEKHGCTFRRGIELSAEAAGADGGGTGVGGGGRGVGEVQPGVTPQKAEAAADRDLIADTKD